jgi:hypothetical protein
MIRFKRFSMVSRRTITCMHCSNTASTASVARCKYQRVREAHENTDRAETEKEIGNEVQSEYSIT